MSNVVANLKQRLSQDSPLLAVGVFDSLSALIVEKAGFEAAFVSGSAMAYSQLARPDIGLFTLTEVALTLERIRDRVELFLLVDADSGFGNAYNVQRAVRTLERAGANGIQLEDQQNTKHVSQITARPIVSMDTMIGKIKTALDSRLNADTVISARTDAALTMGLDEALERADAYLEAGADMVFVEGLYQPAEIQRLVELSKGRAPVLYNLLDPAKYNVDKLQNLGISMILYPSVIIESVASSAQRTAAELARQVGLSNSHYIEQQDINALINSRRFIANTKKYDQP